MEQHDGKIFAPAAQGGHQYLRRAATGLRGGSGAEGPGGGGQGPHRVRSLPLLRPVRQGGGFLRPMGLRAAVRGRHHPHRQALPAAGGGQKAPPLGLSRDNTAKKPLIFRESRKKSLANSYRLWYDISAFRTGADSRSVPQGWPGGGSLWR